MTVLQLTQDVPICIAFAVEPEAKVLVRHVHTVVIMKQARFNTSPVGVGDGTTAVGADKRLLRAAAAVAQPGSPDLSSSHSVSSTRVLLLCAGCGQVGSERGAGRLRLVVVDKPFYQTQTAAGTASEALRTAARSRLVTWKHRRVQMGYEL